MDLIEFTLRLITWKVVARIAFGTAYLSLCIWTVRNRWRGFRRTKRHILVTALEVSVLLPVDRVHGSSLQTLKPSANGGIVQISIWFLLIQVLRSRVPSF